MKSNSVQLFQTAGIAYSWQPVAEFGRFELAIFYRGEYDKSLSPQIIYVDGGRIKLERILAVWNESKNFKYEVKKMSPKSLLELCLDIHMHHTGASDPLPEYEKDVRVLVSRLENWQPNPHDQFAPFDNAIKELIKATLDEVAEHARTNK